MNNDDTITFVSAQPVIVTYNRTTGRWSLEVDLGDLLDGLSETAEADPDYITATEVEVVTEAWNAITDRRVPTATADIRFVEP